MLLRDRIPLKYTFGTIRVEFFVILAYATIVWWLYNMLNLHKISIPLAVPALLGTVISLLLGFRSNQAYDRWWEARQVWGSIVNDSRSLTRQALAYLGTEYPGPEVAYFQKNMIKRQVAWTHSLGQMLRGKNPMTGMDKYVSRNEAEYLSRHNNVPAAILNLHARDLRRAMSDGWLNNYQQMEMDNTLTRLCDAQGKCERIKNTVFPVTYSTYIHFSLLLFIGLLPFALILLFGIFMIPMVAAVSACFLLIEKMAIHLQDPFDNKPTDTPVTSIARTIERDLMQMLNDPEMETTVGATNKESAYYYIM